MPDVPYGYCHCGCGEKTKLARQSNSTYGHVKGQPVRFLPGHYSKSIARPLAERFWEKVDRRGPDECWEWQRILTPGGYGSFNIDNRTARYAHRLAYELVVGPVPEGLELDHLCRNRACVNPDHLEPVTHAENLRRSPLTRNGQAHCSKGHPYTEANTYTWHGERCCRVCHRERQRAYVARQKARRI